MKRAELTLTYSCQNGCIFCSERDNRVHALKSRVTTAAVKKKILDMRQSGAEHITFLGGEPTLRPDFIELVACAKELGFERVYMTTNGRKLSDFDYAKALFDAGLTNVNLSVHGHNETLHDFIVCGEGAFRQTISAVENLKKLGRPFDFSTVICKPNAQFLTEIYRFLTSLAPRRLSWSLTRPVGLAYSSFEAVVPSLEEVGRNIRPALSLALADRKPLTAAHAPLCILGEFVGFSDELYWRKDGQILREVRKFHAYSQVSKETKEDVVYRAAFHSGKVKPKVCASCAYFGVCAGVFKEYYDRAGDGELKAVKGEFVRNFKTLRLPFVEEEN